MELLRHQLAALIATVCVCATGALLAFAHPAYHRGATVSYRVAYGASDAERAFAAAGLPLVRHSAASLSTRDLRVEVDVFGDPRELAANGSPDEMLDAQGRHVLMPRTCEEGIPVAARWRENVRVVVACGTARPGDLARAARALALLPSRQAR